jgi:L-lactate dehydrogenase complex protein LldG
MSIRGFWVGMKLMRSTTPSSARDAILNRITAAIGPAALNASPAADWEKLSRDYIRTDSLTGTAVVELFEHRLKDYGANIFHCSADQIRETTKKILTDRAAKRLVIPAGISPDWLAPEITFLEDKDLSYDALNKVDGVLTTATIAIAATGSIVLQHGPGQGRRALTLIPDYHLCIVKTDQVVETVPAAFARLESSEPTTFISGPSATADIEMTRIKGVHGPRCMDVLLGA